MASVIMQTAYQKAKNVSDIQKVQIFAGKLGHSTLFIHQIRMSNITQIVLQLAPQIKHYKIKISKNQWEIKGYTKCLVNR